VSGPRSTRVKRPATFWVSHSVGLIVGSGFVVGLVLGLALWYRDSTSGTAGLAQLVFDVVFLGLVVGALLAMLLIVIVGAWASVPSATGAQRSETGRRRAAEVGALAPMSGFTRTVVDGID
jgi:hypothetical protein